MYPGTRCISSEHSTTLRFGRQVNSRYQTPMHHPQESLRSSWGLRQPLLPNARPDRFAKSVVEFVLRSRGTRRALNEKTACRCYPLSPSGIWPTPTHPSKNDLPRLAHVGCLAKTGAKENKKNNFPIWRILLLPSPPEYRGRGASNREVVILVFLNEYNQLLSIFSAWQTRGYLL